MMFRIITGVILLAFVMHRAYYTRQVQHDEDDVAHQPPETLATRIAGTLSILAFIATLSYLFYPRGVAWAALILPLWLRFLGIGLVAAGFLLLQWAQVTLAENWSDAPVLLAEHQLITSGPYRWLRHPIYTAFLMILGSLLLISANWFVGGLWLIMTGLDIAGRVTVEEKLMLEQFGDRYQTYMQHTGRLLPRLRYNKNITENN